MVVKASALALVLFCLSPSSGWADIFCCKGPDGVIYFTNAPTGERPYKLYLREAPVRTDYDPIIKRICERHGVDFALVKAIIKAESEFNPRAVSRKGAMGLMQLMPSTASLMRVSNPFDPSENIEAGVRYLKSLLERFNYNLPLALAAYNAGPRAVEERGGIPDYPETRSYVARVLQYYRSFRGGYGRQGAAVEPLQ